MDMVPPGKRRKMILLLMVLTPGIPEYLTGSTPFTELFLNPFQFLLSAAFNIGFYTTGALLIREFAVRFGKGYASILLLGLAYGIMEEGIAVHTFFLASGNPVGDLAVYGRFAGVNWVWAVCISFFHSVFSIALPILLLSLAFPEFSRERLLNRKNIKTVLFLYLLDVFIIDLVSPIKPLYYYYPVFLAIVVILIAEARRIPSDAVSPKGVQHVKSGKLLISGLLVFPVYLTYSYIAGSTHGFGFFPPVVDIIACTLTYMLLLRFVTHHIPVIQNERALFVLATGLIIPLLFWAELLEFLRAIPTITIVVVIAIVMLIRLGHSIGKSVEPEGSIS